MASGKSSKSRSSYLGKRKSKPDHDSDLDSDFEQDRESESDFEPDSDSDDDMDEFDYEEKLFGKARKEVGDGLGDVEPIEPKKRSEEKEKSRKPRKRARTQGKYKCDHEDCESSFDRYSNLVRHRRIHTGEKRFRCKDCGKKFQEAHHLAAHERTHTGEKPFGCKRCGKDFTDDSNRKRHQKTCGGTRKQAKKKVSVPPRSQKEKRKPKNVSKSGVQNTEETEEKKDPGEPPGPGNLSGIAPPQSEIPRSGFLGVPVPPPFGGGVGVPPMPLPAPPFSRLDPEGFPQPPQTPSAFQFVSPRAQESLARLRVPVALGSSNRSPTPAVKVEGGGEMSPRSRLATDLYMRVLTPLLMGRAHGEGLRS